MGNACCNNADNKDQHAQDYNTTNKPQIKDKDVIDPEVIKKATENEQKIVKLQANTRGYLARKQLRDEKGEVSDKNKPKISSRTS